MIQKWGKKKKILSAKKKKAENIKIHIGKNFFFIQLKKIADKLLWKISSSLLAWESQDVLLFRDA